MTWVDQARKVVWRDGAEIRLSPRQFALCAYLASEPGVIRSRADIMDALKMSEDLYETAVDTTT